MFELTTQEENLISELFAEISQITIDLLQEGCFTNDFCQVNAFDILESFFEGREKERGTLFRSSILQVNVDNNYIKIEGNMDKHSINFLEQALNKQIEFFEKHIPNALEGFIEKQKNCSNKALQGNQKVIGI